MPRPNRSSNEKTCLTARPRSASLPVHAVGGTEVRLIGGERLDQSFLADLSVAPKDADRFV